MGDCRHITTASQQCQTYRSNRYTGQSQLVTLVTHIPWMRLETDYYVLSGFHSAVIHIRMRFQSGNNHNRPPHLASEHLVYFAAWENKNLQKPLIWLKSLQIHSLNFTWLRHSGLWHAQSSLFSWPDTGPSSQIQRMLSNPTHSQPEDPSLWVISSNNISLPRNETSNFNP